MIFSLTKTKSAAPQLLLLLLLLVVAIPSASAELTLNDEATQGPEEVYDFNVGDDEATAGQVLIEEPQVEGYDEVVCPSDYILMKRFDSTAAEGEASQRQRNLIEEPNTNPIKIVRQAAAESYVEFTVQNTTWFSILESEDEDETYYAQHIFTSFVTDQFGSEHCYMDENMVVAPIDSDSNSNISIDIEGTSTSSSTEVMKAHCHDTPNAGSIAIVKTFVRYYKNSGSASSSGVEIPKCCQDPYASTDNSELYKVVEYIFELKCTVSVDCEDPEEYFDGTTNGGGDDDDIIVVLSPTASPTVAPTTIADSSIPTASPTMVVSASPTITQEEEDECLTIPKRTSPLSRDLVMGSLLNGPHWGSRHGWAWPGHSNNGCSRYATVDDIGPGANAWPCSVDRQLLNRVLNFDSAYMNVKFEFDWGMKVTIALANSNSDNDGDDNPATQAISFYPSGGTNDNGNDVYDDNGSNACSEPPEKSWNDYPIRLVKSGRYLHHWYAEQVGCNGEADDTRIELKVTPDCVELHMISETGANLMNWMASNGDMISSTNGYAGISYCVQCASELAGDDKDEVGGGDDLSGCTIVQTPIPTDCCPLSGATAKDGTDMCGTGWEYNTCDASSSTAITTELTKDVVVSTSPSYPVKGDGHSYEVRIPRGAGSQLVNDVVTVNINNNSPDNKWRKVKVNFHIEKPRRITGVSGILRDPVTQEPTGIHIQMSKNWHENRDALYNSYWWTGITHIRVPPGQTSLELVVAYQYYKGLHGVSHSQLSLLGWATNGLWEEVGLGSNGESITYEPHGHHRRQMILDTRPWLTCATNRDGCVGSPDSTQWTENVGGGDFLNAVDKKGMYQYLVGDTTYHTMNGPRLTNATYAGVTVDQNIAVSRTVSTWTADDFVRHLHSFQYTFLKETDGDNYPRFAMYTLGGDNYNYVQFPLFAYGMGGESVLDSLPIKDVISGVSDFHYTDYYQVEAPKGCSQGNAGSCWFVMLTNPSQNIHQRGHRGVVVRNFHGQLNGEPWPPVDGGNDVSPFTFNMVKSRQNGSAQNTVSIELGLPSEFLAAVDAGQAKFREGDYLAADIELFVPPRQTVDYFGKSERLKSWLSEAGVDTNYENGWKVIAKEADMGDAIETSVFQGTLERLYHPRVHVDCSDEARFNIEIPDGMPGILPITISGVGASNSFPTSLLGRPDEKLWRYVGDNWKEVGVGGSYQLEKDVLDNSHTFVYSLSLEFESDPVGNCEQFAFGATAPSEPNPSCE